MSLAPGLRIGPYEVISALGAGGMGEVYRARDWKLGREVALKILPEPFARDADRLARFAREARTLASLNHPHIAQIYGVEESETIRAFAMELVEGETLAQRLARGPLRLEEALETARQIADALDAAHERGIVHRDVKPNNIKVRSDGTVKVLDFGLAKVLGGSTAGDSAESPTVTELETSPGAILGTTAYMSPEQARGQALDKRTDIWSFGCVLYAMLTGRAAFSGDTMSDTVAGILERDPDWDRLPARTPPGVRRLLRRCLDKNVRLRLRDIGDAQVDLHEALSPSAGASHPPRPASARAAEMHEEPDVEESIVVLPFVNLSSDPAHEFFSDGLTDEIISGLASVPNLRVVARTSAFQFKARGADVRQVGRDLGVGTALEGSIRHDGSRIRATAQLIDIANGLHLWSDRYDREVTNVFSIQEEITCAIVTALRARLGPRGRSVGVSERPTPSPEAYEWYLRGRYFYHKATTSALEKSVGCMERAIASDAQYAAAFAGLADACLMWMSLAVQRPPSELLSKARYASRAALELDPSSAEAHCSLGEVLAIADWDFPGAEREFCQALQLKPSFVHARMLYSVSCLTSMRRHDEAVAQLREALRTDPMSVLLRVMLGQALVVAGRCDDAVRELSGALEWEPGFVFGHYTLALAYLAASRYQDALDTLLHVKDSEGASNYAGHLGYAQAKLGHRQDAEHALHELLGRPWVPAVDVAAIYNALGKTREAVDWLTHAREARQFDSLFVRDDPRFQNLLSDPRLRRAYHF